MTLTEAMELALLDKEIAEERCRGAEQDAMQYKSSIDGESQF